MKLKRKTFLKFNLVLIIILLFNSSSYAEDDISIKNWNVKAKLLDNGDLEIVEDLNFRFNESFNGVFRDISFKDTDGIENLNIEEIKDQPILYSQVDEADKGDSNVFVETRENDKSIIKIFSPSDNEEKTFRFSYTVKNLANKYRDTSELYYKFIGDANETFIENLDIEILLPKDRVDMVKIFAHGPSNGTINFFDDRTILLAAENIRPNTMVEGRILFPNSFIENKKEILDKDMFDTIMAEEESFIQKEENKLIRKEKYKKISNILSPITIILAALLGFLGRRKSKYKTEVYEKELGEDMLFLPPMINSILVKEWFIANPIPTNLYSLAYKGHIEIEDCGFFKRKYQKEDIENFKISKLNKNREDLLSHEIYLLDFLFNDIAGSDSITAEDLDLYLTNNPFTFQKFLSKSHKLAMNDLRQLGLKDDSKVSFGTFLIVIASLFIPLALFNFFGAGNIIDGFIDILIFIILLVLGINLVNKKSDLGQTQYKKLIKFKEDVLKNRIDIIDEEYLITAMALNIPMENLEEYKDNFSSQVRIKNNWIYWYFLMDSSGNNVLASSISSSSDTSGSFGTGGGFSSGGGGGAGGGGAGGF